MTEDRSNDNSRDYRQNSNQNDESSQRRFEGQRGGYRGSGGHRGGQVSGGPRGGRGGGRGGYGRRDDGPRQTGGAEDQGSWRVESRDTPPRRDNTNEYVDEGRFERPQGQGRGGYRGGEGNRGGRYHVDPERFRGGRGGGRRDNDSYGNGEEGAPRDRPEDSNRDGQRDHREGGQREYREGGQREYREGGQREFRNNNDRFGSYNRDNQGRRDDRVEGQERSMGEGEVRNQDNHGERRFNDRPYNSDRQQHGFPGRSSRVRQTDGDLKPLRYETRPQQEAHPVRAEQHRDYDEPHQHDDNPKRTERAPRLRRNNFDLKEVEDLLQQRHNQRGISFDNYESIAVEIVPNDVEAVTTFQGLNIHPILDGNIKRCGYERPTPVQKYGIPVSMAGKDLMACAQTGSGKTAAFLVPVVNHILVHGVSPAVNRMSYPIALIMAPTRELALQIYDESRKLVYKSDIFCDVVYGGTSYPIHFEQDILVACPGRLKDIFDRNQISFSRTKYLILDEADRMLEMGFEEQIEYLVGSIHSDMPPPEQRQTLMFSATFPVPIRNLAQKYLRRHYYLLTVGRVGSTTRNITQRLMWVEDSEKQDKLMELLYQQNQTDLVLVFVETKRSAEDLYALLYDSGIPTGTIHGDRKQGDREEALRRFKDGRTPILVATDVASRGLDIPNVAHVIQYDLPRSMDDYTHRIGRTGRAGNEGVATSFFNNDNTALTEELLSYLSEHEQTIPDWIENMKEEREMQHFVSANRTGGPRKNGGGRGGNRGGGRRFDDAPTSWDDEPRPSRGRGRGGFGEDAGPKPAAKKAAPAPKVSARVAGGGF